MEKTSNFLKITEGLITSVSGWRKIFSAVDDDSTISSADFLLMYYAVTSYLSVLDKNDSSLSEQWTIALGRDSRATGKSIISAVIQACQDYKGSAKITVINLDIVASPQIMAYTRMHADGFIYITASHNPKEYNGIKFGNKFGQVLSKDFAQEIIDTFFSIYVEKIKIKLADNFTPPSIKSTKNTEQIEKLKQAYKDTVLHAVFRGLSNDTQTIQHILKERIEKYLPSFAMIWDSNGGARSGDFDANFFLELGVHLHAINTDFGVFNHEIIPEGDSLQQAEAMLIACNKDSTDAREYPIAFVCDCDGDRGNAIFSFQIPVRVP